MAADQFSLSIGMSEAGLIFCVQLGYWPFTKAILKSKKLRHEIGQGEETDQTREMRNLERRYSHLKEVCDAQGTC